MRILCALSVSRYDVLIVCTICIADWLPNRNLLCGSWEPIHHNFVIVLAHRNFCCGWFWHQIGTLCVVFGQVICVAVLDHNQLCLWIGT